MNLIPWLRNLIIALICAVIFMTALMVNLPVFNRRIFKLINMGDYSKSGPEVRHIVFLKVHKAAGTTVMNIIMRFAINMSLSIMLPRKRNTFTGGNPFNRVTILPSFYDNKLYDVLCNHVVYNRQFMARYFPTDTVYIGIVRQPFDQFVSAFMYYRNKYHVKYLVRIPGENPIKTYLSDPSKYEAKKLPFSYTNNRMTFDFGYPGQDFNNMDKFKDYLKQLDTEFDLVLIVEMFDESLILLKRLLKWRLQDILYVKQKVGNYSHNATFTDSDKSIHEKWDKLDYALYHHFRSVLISKIQLAGAPFIHELRYFKQCQRRVNQFCSVAKNTSSLVIEKSDYNAPFVVSYADCRLLKVAAGDLIKHARKKHSHRLDQFGIKYCAKNLSKSECEIYLDNDV